MSAPTVRVGLDTLRFPKPVLAGMNLLLINYFTYRMRTTDWTPDPIRVSRDGDGWRIVDGRHRAVASMAAGHTEIAAVVVE